MVVVEVRGDRVKAIVERDFLTMRVNVWFYRRVGHHAVSVAQRGEAPSAWEWSEPFEASMARPDTPSLTLDEEMMTALIEAGSATMPPDRAQGRHLDDTIATRDRLLALVELTWRAS